MNMTSYITDVIEGRKKSSFLKGALYLMSNLFEAGVKLRNLAFDRQWLKEKKVSVPVISIGNIIAGGTGKTAFIQRLAKDLNVSGKVSILSRGYRSEIEKVGGSLHLTPQARITPDVCGDEAFLLFKSLPDVALFVGKDRVLNAERAAYHDASVVLLDDGMQYRTLHRDFEIVMLHADDLYGKGFFLPRGYLRDSPKRLRNADAIIINHIHDLDQFHALEKEVARWTNAPLIGTRMVPKQVKFHSGDYLQDLRSKRVGVFCGLGKPQSFFATVKEMGATITEKWILPDHVRPKEKDLRSFVERCAERGCEFILCSEKDWVKLAQDSKYPLPIGFVEAELTVVAQEECYKDLLEQIQAQMLTKEAS